MPLLYDSDKDNENTSMSGSRGTRTLNNKLRRNRELIRRESSGLLTPGLRRDKNKNLDNLDGTDKSGLIGGGNGIHSSA